MTFAEKKQVHTFYNEKKTKQQKYIAMTVDWQTNTQTNTRTNTQTHTNTNAYDNGDIHTHVFKWALQSIEIPLPSLRTVKETSYWSFALIVEGTVSLTYVTRLKFEPPSITCSLKKIRVNYLEIIQVNIRRRKKVKEETIGRAKTMNDKEKKKWKLN